MRNEVSVNRLERSVRPVLLSISILCVLIPAVAVIFAVDTDYKRAAFAHDSAVTAEAASQISLTIRSVEEQLHAAQALDGTGSYGDGVVRSFLRALQSSNNDLIRVGFVARGGNGRTAAGGRAALPVYHVDSTPPSITIRVPLSADGDDIAAVVNGATVTRRLGALAGGPGTGAYLYTVAGRLLASSGAAAPWVAFEPLAGQPVAQRVVTGPPAAGGRGVPDAHRGLRSRRSIRSRGGLRASTWYVTEMTIRGTDWVLVLERPGRGLLSARFPIVFGGASVLFAALMALLSALLLLRSPAGPVPRRLEDAIRRNEILLRETHHRVKNDLQILSSILHLSDRPGLASGAHTILAESQNRVNAISLTHELLYKSSDLAAGINMRTYVSELIRRIESSLVGDSGTVSIVSNVGNFFLDADTSVACGLLLNELLTNSLKYAFPNGDGGVILVRIEQVGRGHYLLQVQDDGVGLPKGSWFPGGGSLGMRLIRALTEQLCGTVSVESDPGTSWRILFDAPAQAIAAVR